jgi:3-oxoacyl-[acyl-carrier protein] reductase
MLPTYGTYCQTNLQLKQLTRVFAKEVGNKGITVKLHQVQLIRNFSNKGKNEEV